MAENKCVSPVILHSDWNNPSDIAAEEGEVTSGSCDEGFVNYHCDECGSATRPGRVDFECLVNTEVRDSNDHPTLTLYFHDYNPTAPNEVVEATAERLASLCHPISNCVTPVQDGSVVDVAENHGQILQDGSIVVVADQTEHTWTCPADGRQPATKGRCNEGIWVDGTDFFTLCDIGLSCVNEDTEVETFSGNVETVYCEVTDDNVDLFCLDGLMFPNLSEVDTACTEEDIGAAKSSKLTKAVVAAGCASAVLFGVWM